MCCFWKNFNMNLNPRKISKVQVTLQIKVKRQQGCGALIVPVPGVVSAVKDTVKWRDLFTTCTCLVTRMDKYAADMIGLFIPV